MPSTSLSASAELLVTHTVQH